MEKQTRTTEVVHFVFVIASFLYIRIYGTGKTNNDNVKNVSLKEIFNIIENQTPYRFSYRSVVLDADRNISISAENISVTTVLNQALKDRNLEYSIVSPKTIVISDKQTGNVKSSETKKYPASLKM